MIFGVTFNSMFALEVNWVSRWGGIFEQSLRLYSLAERFVVVYVSCHGWAAHWGRAHLG